MYKRVQDKLRKFMGASNDRINLSGGQNSSGRGFTATFEGEQTAFRSTVPSRGLPYAPSSAGGHGLIRISVMMSKIPELIQDVALFKFRKFGPLG